MQPHSLRIQDPLVRAVQIGLDLGQTQDYSAVSVIEHESRIVGRHANYSLDTEQHLNLIHLERIPLGTSYPEVVSRVEALIKAPELAYCRLRLLIDATGVGAPVVDLLDQAKLGIPLTAVHITGGEDIRVSGKRLYIPKKDLVANLQLQLQKRRLHVPRGMASVNHFYRELREFRLRTTTKGRERFNGPHDDLVLASALAAWPQSAQTYGEQARRIL